MYDIFALGESAITVSGGGQLDGVTQGDGTHLPGLTLTINTPDWQQIAITDNDPNFQDSDGSQQLDGDQTFDGVLYTNGTRVEAEYGITVTDGVDTWTLVGFNINNSTPAFGTVEGIAVIGGPGSFPPPGVALTVTSAFEGPSFAATDYATPICFAAGTEVACVGGSRVIEALKVGDRVLTEAHGLQEIRWIGARMVPAIGRGAPVRFEAGTLGNHRPLRVSQQHRVLIEGWEAELHWGLPRVLVPAHRLINGRSVRLDPGWMVLYVHVLLERHALLWAEGALCESLFPGKETFEILGPDARRAVRRLIGASGEMRLAAPVVQGPDARIGGAHLQHHGQANCTRPRVQA